MSRLKDAVLKKFKHELMDKAEDVAVLLDDAVSGSVTTDAEKIAWFDKLAALELRVLPGIVRNIRDHISETDVDDGAGDE